MLCGYLIAPSAFPVAGMGPFNRAAHDARLVEFRPTVNLQMDTGMVTSKKNRNVFGSVIQSVPVLMMDMLSGFKRSFHNILRNDPVFVGPYIRVGNLHPPVPQSICAPMQFSGSDWKIPAVEFSGPPLLDSRFGEVYSSTPITPSVVAESLSVFSADSFDGLTADFTRF